MPLLQPDSRAIEREIESVYRLYAALARDLAPETGLGGRLLYAGDPAQSGLAFLRAANIAGAASLAASADAAALRRAMREGALDFVVTSLDEALRILKNEIRKRQPVAVGVTIAASTVESEMAGRGVQPDRIAAGLATSPALQLLLGRGAHLVEPQPLPAGSLHILPVPPGRQPAVWEAELAECLPPEDHLNRRWLRLAPRYLPAGARRLRSLIGTADFRTRLEALRQETPRLDTPRPETR